MTIPGSDTNRQEVSLRHGTSLGRRLTADMAALVLAFATGLPLRSARTLLPERDESGTPYLGL